MYTAIDTNVIKSPFFKEKNARSLVYAATAKSVHQRTPRTPEADINVIKSPFFKENRTYGESICNR